MRDNALTSCLNLLTGRHPIATWTALDAAGRLLRAAREGDDPFADAVATAVVRVMHDGGLPLAKAAVLRALREREPGADRLPALCEYVTVGRRELEASGAVPSGPRQRTPLPTRTRQARTARPRATADTTRRP